LESDVTVLVLVDVKRHVIGQFHQADEAEHPNYQPDLVFTDQMLTRVSGWLKTVSWALRSSSDWSSGWLGTARLLALFLSRWQWKLSWWR